MPNIPFKCPHCDQSIEAPMEMLGQLIDCPACGETVEVQKSPVKLAPLPPPPLRAMPKLKLPMPPPIARKPSRIKEYKVLSQRDKWFAGTFDPEKLEQALNACAAQGWHFISIATLPIPETAGDRREETIVVMGRDK